jgi:outer membrane lipoprotein-sorting protein
VLFRSANYQDFGSFQYPTTIILKRPLEEYQIVLTIEKVTENMELEDAQFQVKVPEGTKIQKME